MAAAASLMIGASRDPRGNDETKLSLFHEMEELVAQGLPELLYRHPEKSFRDDSRTIKLVRCGSIARKAARLLRLFEAKIRLGERYLPTSDLEQSKDAAKVKLKRFLIGTDISHEAPHDCMYNALLLIKGNTLLYGGHVKEALACGRKLFREATDSNFRAFWLLNGSIPFLPLIALFSASILYISLIVLLLNLTFSYLLILHTCRLYSPLPSSLG